MRALVVEWLRQNAEFRIDPNTAIVTHAGEESCIRDTLDRLAGSDSLLGTPMVMHILD